jgi:hypothetical protein
VSLDNLDKTFADISSAQEEEAPESNKDAQEDETSEFN